MQSNLEQRTVAPTPRQAKPNAQLAPSQPEDPQRSSVNVGDTERIMSSLLGGALLLSSLRAPTPRKAAQLMLGAAIMQRGLTGHCYMYAALGRSTASARAERVAVERTLTIGKSVDELYRAWRDPKHIAAIMGHIARVEDASDGRLRWTLALARQHEITWMTSLTADLPGELIAWRTEPDAPFTHQGSVRFRKAPRGLGTEVTLCMAFGAELGVIDRALRKLTGPWLRTIPRTLEESILRRCKSLCETGEIPTLAHNPSAREPAPPEARSIPQNVVGVPSARSFS